MTLPLSRIRVLDVSQIMAGPYCCMLLGDMGADVIKVETPGVGDQTRRAMGFKLKGEDSGGFIALNRNKRSVEIDLKNPQGLEAFYELVRSADVLVENNRPGVAARLKIDYPTLQAINPRLVYASISGFGQTGPWALRPGLDLIAQASCGAMSVMGEPGGEPMKSSVPFADLGAALFAAYAILSAVIGRGETGQGQYIDASLFETALGLSIWETAEFWGTGRVPSPLGSANRMSAPYQAIRAADRHLVIGAANPKLWAALCAVIERPDLLADPRFTDNVERLKNRKALIALLEQEFARRPAAEWVDLLLAAGVPAAPIQNYEEALDCEQARARDMVMEGEHPIEGKVKMLGFPVKLRGTPQQIRRVAPLLGAHTQEVFSELGLSAERIERLRAAGAFGARGKTAVPA
ncbi:CoA transferase [Achromobacter denitrificans]|uniref:CaiB/BaiF CoA transferase family protein n=1 Tax=Achromobacter denitrificans TaxID=32002 RepID=UPI000F4E4AC3|nr:CoA transferase [Achromobacter denitrificans]MDF3862796.1 CoA transferase [Achromobacter denitrificans]MDF3938583.1 CoA transferase [Achromobacter denitrificans]MPT41840.1 CoA transferase [Achromobacter sp.]QCS64760.1 CoA transferase [Achromobacter denitrificans]